MAGSRRCLTAALSGPAGVASGSVVARFMVRRTWLRIRPISPKILKGVLRPLRNREFVMVNERLQRREWDPRSPLQARQQARSIPAAAAHLLHLGIELVDHGGHRAGCAALARPRGAHAQGLSHPIHPAIRPPTLLCPWPCSGSHSATPRRAPVE